MIGAFPLPPTRFGKLTPLAAASLLLGLLLLIVAGLFGGAPSKSAVARDGQGDQALYMRIIDDVAAGQSYYSAVVAEHRRGHYPLKPAVAVRGPLLATVMAALQNDILRTLSLRILVIAVLAAWVWRLRALFGWTRFTRFATLPLICGVLPALVAGAYSFHEVWAGALIALSLAVHNPQRWWPSVVIGFLALALRELSLVYLVVMGSMALVEGRRREVLAWGVAIIAFFCIFAIHAHLLAPHLQVGDAASSGWLAFGGWPFVLSTIKWNAVLVIAPHWLVCIALPFMLLGLAGWPGPLGARLALTAFGYTLAFLAAGRPDNSYWGLIVAPLMTLGFLMAPGSVMDVLRALRVPLGRAANA
jgi:hypothetical protein